MAVTGGAVAASGNYYSSRALGQVDSIQLKTSNDQLNPAVAKGPTAVENYLLVGSDSRTGADPTDVDFGGIGTKVSGHRSDTMLVLRYDPATKRAALLSVPRDLWVVLADTGRKDRVNEAFDRDDPTVRSQNLLDTISKTLEIPIHHYVEVNFAGFKTLVNALGGVNIWIDYPIRDTHTGLEVFAKAQSCVLLDGVSARQYVRSRSIDELRNGKWVRDETSDYGRMARQRDFISRAINKAASKVTSDPLSLGQMLKAVASSVRKDDGIDLDGLAQQFKGAASDTALSFQLPTRPEMISGNSVLLLEAVAAKPILDIFRGIAPMVEAASATTAPPAAAPAPTPAPAPSVPATVDPSASCR